ncbi:hypothetical protein tinsulaeT_37090 [Thalassotalea insulae]|uniref:Uncharacterized protein n=1 Tax=Thalassotalea insulae TaxID=2056778 RepID=A0ABQ6GXH2_9GAMM|nr:hypothetical protein [Thalassotalea insulae]GLX80369.1 hypothetical protein tinsulaeT_37090 [Thalassotalea insulae]
MPREKRKNKAAEIRAYQDSLTESRENDANRDTEFAAAGGVAISTRAGGSGLKRHQLFNPETIAGSSVTTQQKDGEIETEIISFHNDEGESAEVHYHPKTREVHQVFRGRGRGAGRSTTKYRNLSPDSMREVSGYTRRTMTGDTKSRAHQRAQRAVQAELDTN